MDIERFQKTKDSAFVPDFVIIQSILDILKTDLLNRIKNIIQSIDDDTIDKMFEECIINDYDEQTYNFTLSMRTYGHIKINKTNQRLTYMIEFSNGLYESHTLLIDDSVKLLSLKQNLYDLLENVNGKYDNYTISKRDFKGGYDVSYTLTDSEISNIYGYIKELLTNYGATIIKHKTDTSNVSCITTTIKIKNPVYGL